jgi:lipoprotein-anchoring transpeptidase ErfK/SrfK
VAKNASRSRWATITPFSVDRRLAGILAALALALLAAGCGSPSRRAAPAPPQHHVLAAKKVLCHAGELKPLGTKTKAYVAVAPHGAVTYRRPGGAVAYRFARRNVNGYPTVFEVLGEVLDKGCKAQWYRVELPVRPNGTRGYVRVHAVDVQTVDTRIEVDLSRKQLTLYAKGKPVLTTTVAVGSSSTPTPIGRYYVNQRLVPGDPQGPYGPAAVGVSAFSNVLTGWAQGGPIGIHGTDEPWSIGHAVSNGCVRLPNATMARLFKLAPAGTPVIIHP